MLQCCGFAGNRLKAGRPSELARAVAFPEAIQLYKLRRLEVFVSWVVAQVVLMAIKSRTSVSDVPFFNLCWKWVSGSWLLSWSTRVRV